jgi:hypothetical protein
MGMAMERKPQRYGTPELRGYKAYMRWAPIGERLYANAEDAQRACELHAGRMLRWEVAVRTPQGNPLWNGLPQAGGTASDAYQASPHQVAEREDIPGAEFVSPDPACNFYIEPEGKRWSVYSMIDLEGHDPFEVMMITGGSSEQDGHDAARLWNFRRLVTDDKAIAIAYGRFLWGRALVLQNSPPPPTAGKLRERIRGWAAAWL